MTDHINDSGGATRTRSAVRGPAYPALLVFGMPIVVTPRYGAPYVAVYMERATPENGGEHYVASPATNRANHTLGYRSLGEHDVIEIDHADPHTRDRVARVLMNHAVERAHLSLFSEVDDLHDEDIRGEDVADAFRALAAAVWGAA